MALEFLEDREVQAVVWGEGRADLVLVQRVSPVPVLVIVQVLVNICRIAAFLEASLRVLHLTPITQLRVDVISIEIRGALPGSSACWDADGPRFTIHMNNNFNKSRDHLSCSSRL